MLFFIKELATFGWAVLNFLAIKISNEVLLKCSYFLIFPNSVLVIQNTIKRFVLKKSALFCSTVFKIQRHRFTNTGKGGTQPGILEKVGEGGGSGKEGRGGRFVPQKTFLLQCCSYKLFPKMLTKREPGPCRSFPLIRPWSGYCAFHRKSFLKDLHLLVFYSTFT